MLWLELVETRVSNSCSSRSSLRTSLIEASLSILFYALRMRYG
jgi:hypothetical protein